MRLALLLLLAALPVSATTVSLQQFDGTAVAGGDVCWFRAGDAENPFQRWLLSQDVKCAGSDRELSLPSGLWNVFGRTADAISTPTLVLAESAPRSLALTLLPAATVRSSRNAVVYAPRLAAAWPGGTVPAGEELLLFVIEKGRPVGVFDIPALAAGSERMIDGSASAPPSVVGWLQVPDEDRRALGAARGLAPPRIRIGTKESDVLPPVDRLHGAFVRVRGVDAGDAEMSVQGRGFLSYRRRTRVEDSLTLVADPVLVRPSATLVVSWTARRDLGELNASLATCETSPEPARHLIAVSRCPDPSDCTVIREEPIDVTMGFGSFNVDEIPPGTYRAEIRIGKLPPIVGGTVLGALQVRRIALNAEYLLAHGTVSLGGEPLDENIEVRFPGGYGFLARGNDEYQAALLAPLFRSDLLINVNACDGSPRALVVSEQELRRGGRLDIDIPANRLTIRVSDTFTREPLGGASVRYTLMSKLDRPRRVIHTRTFAAESDGTVTIPYVPEREVRLQVTHPGYGKRDVEPFTMSRSEEREVEVQLVPLRGTGGRVLSPKPFESGTVLWFSRDGFETERADLAPDGTYVQANEHRPDETMAVVSASHPLYVTRARLTLQFPEVAARTVFVTVEGQDARDLRHIGVTLGGIRVPPPALQLHQALRREPAAVRGAGPLALRDLADSGPLELLLGPLVGEVASRATGMDFFVLPQFAGAPKQPVPPGAAAAVFVLR